MELIDSHCHPQFPQYDKDREEMIKRTLDGGVRMICVGTDLEMSKRAIELANKYEGIWAAVGLHPNDNFDEEFNPKAYEELAKEPKVVAMGEIGLDFYRTPEADKQVKQKERFIQQIDAATQLNLPVIIHCRDAHEDMIEILSTRAEIKAGSQRGVIHSFTGTWQQAQKYFDLGFSIGLNGIITFANQYDETVINAPLDRILLETDAPYLAPVPYRGKRNEPLYTIEVAKRIAELREKAIEEIAQNTVESTRKLFNMLE